MTPPESSTAMPPRCYKPFLTRAPALTFFILLNLLIISLVEVAFHKLPLAMGPPLVNNALNPATNSVTSTNSAISSTSKPSTLPLDKRIPSLGTSVTDTPPVKIVDRCDEGGLCVPDGKVQRRSSTSTGPPSTKTDTTAAHLIFFGNSEDGIFTASNPCRAGNPPSSCYSGLMEREESSGAAEAPPLEIRALEVKSPELRTYLPCVSDDDTGHTPTKCLREREEPGDMSENFDPNHPLFDVPPNVYRPSPCLSGNPPGWCLYRKRQATRDGPPILRRTYRYWTIQNGVYFLGNYLPVIIAVLFNELWTITAASIKAMEPFYQLASPTGATGARSLNLKSTSSGVGLVAYHAASQGHWVVFWSSAISLCLTVVVPLSSEMVTIDTHSSCAVLSPRLTHCFGKLRISPIIGRVIQALLGLMAIMTISLTALMWGRWSGVFADPWSCAGLASLFQNEKVLEDFRRLDPQCSNKELAEALARKRYRLGYYLSSRGYVGYGLVMQRDRGQRGGEPRDGGREKTPVLRSNTTKTETKSRSGRRAPARGSLWLHPALLVAFALSLAGLLTMVIYYVVTRGDTGFERFMDSDGFGISFLMTAIGMAIKCYWSKVEEETRAVEPYRNLSAGNAHPRDSILVCAVSNPINAIATAIVRARSHIALLVSNTLLSEVLTVALSRIPFRRDSIYIAYLVSTKLTMAIIPFMLLSLIWIALRRRPNIDMPRRPDTIAAVLSYLCASTMLRDFQGLSTVSGRTRDGLVVKMGRRYKLGTIVGVDDVERVAIDEDIPLPPARAQGTGPTASV